MKPVQASCRAPAAVYFPVPRPQLSLHRIPSHGVFAMHILSALLAFLMSFGHAQTVRHAETDAFVPPSEAVTASIDAPVPSRDDLATAAATSSYAGRACPGCLTTNATLPTP